MTLRPGLGVEHALHVVVDARPVARDAGDQRIGVAMRHHQRAEDVALVGDEPLAVALQVAVALQARIEEVGELLQVRGFSRVDQLVLWPQHHAEGAELLAHHLGRADEDRHAEALREIGVRGADHGRLLALGEDDALGLEREPR